MTNIKEVKKELQNLIIKHWSSVITLKSKEGITLPYTNDGTVYYLPADLTSFRELFYFDTYDVPKVKEINMEGVNFDHVTHMHGMFKDLTALESVKFPKDIKPADYRDMTSMFNDCLKLEKVDLSMFYADKVDMNLMVPTDIKQVTLPRFKEINERVWLFDMSGDGGTTVVFSGDGHIKTPLDTLCYGRREGSSMTTRMRNINLHIPEAMFEGMEPENYENVDDTVSITVY